MCDLLHFTEQQHCPLAGLHLAQNRLKYSVRVRWDDAPLAQLTKGQPSCNAVQPRPRRRGQPVFSACAVCANKGLHGQSPRQLRVADQAEKIAAKGLLVRAHHLHKRCALGRGRWSDLRGVLVFGHQPAVSVAGDALTQFDSIYAWLIQPLQDLPEHIHPWLTDAEEGEPAADLVVIGQQCSTSAPAGHVCRNHADLSLGGQTQ
jgi:hypothetical protein